MDEPKQYIDKNKFLQHMQKTNRYFSVFYDIQNFPTEKVRELIYAEWGHLGGDEWCCTNCGEVVTTEGSWQKPTDKFCHECGAEILHTNTD